MTIMSRIARANANDFVTAHGDKYDPWREAFGAAKTESGRTVSVESALGVAAVWASIRILSDSVGSLPMITYRKTPSGRARAEDARTYTLLHERPNAEMTAQTLWSLVTTHMNSWGNAYLGKTYRGSTVTELWPIHPQRVRVCRENGQKVFRLKDERGVETDKRWTTNEIIHLFGMSLDGLTGLSPIQMARETIGAALAMDEYSNTFFREGTIPRAVLKTKGRLSARGKRSLSTSFERKFRGSSRSNRVAVLEEDVDFKAISLPQKDMEFVQQREHSIQEISRWFRVPVTMLEGDKGKTMQYSTVEGDAIHFLTHSLRPWLITIEQPLNRDAQLFPTNRLFSEFLVDGMLRADTKGRYESYTLALDPEKGWMRRSEVRQLENLPPDSSFDAIVPVPRTAEPARSPSKAAIGERV